MVDPRGRGRDDVRGADGGSALCSCCYDEGFERRRKGSGACTYTARLLDDERAHVGVGAGVAAPLRVHAARGEVAGHAAAQVDELDGGGRLGKVEVGRVVVAEVGAAGAEAPVRSGELPAAEGGAGVAAAVGGVEAGLGSGRAQARRQAREAEGGAHRLRQRRSRERWRPHTTTKRRRVSEPPRAGEGHRGNGPSAPLVRGAP